MSVHAASLILAALIGFAAHRASLCTVRAVGEIMSSGSAHMLGSFARAAALMGGMVASSLQRGAFVWHWPERSAASLLRKAGGGVLKGLGGAMIPGGNDTLVLSAIPTLSPWALAAYLALLSGVAVALVIMKTVFGPMPAISCGDDSCR